jgi:hypothetical protein
MAGDPEDRKSTTGVLFFFGLAPITWQSQKQKVVALSSCEAEYIAATTAACQGVWLSRLLSCIEDGKIAVEYMATNNQLADILTKALGRVKFLELRDKIGMVEIK